MPCQWYITEDTQCGSESDYGCSHPDWDDMTPKERGEQRAYRDLAKRREKEIEEEAYRRVIDRHDYNEKPDRCEPEYAYKEFYE